MLSVESRPLGRRERPEGVNLLLLKVDYLSLRHVHGFTAQTTATLIDRDSNVLWREQFNYRSIVYDRARARVKAGTSAQGKERVKIFIKNPAQR